VDSVGGADPEDAALEWVESNPVVSDRDVVTADEPLTRIELDVEAVPVSVDESPPEGVWLATAVPEVIVFD
jgi:hypothetical protein